MNEVLPIAYAYWSSIFLTANSLLRDWYDSLQRLNALNAVYYRYSL